MSLGTDEPGKKSTIRRAQHCRYQDSDPELSGGEAEKPHLCQDKTTESRQLQPTTASQRETEIAMLCMCIIQSPITESEGIYMDILWELTLVSEFLHCVR